MTTQSLTQTVSVRDLSSTQNDMLKSLQTIMNHTMEGAQGRFDAFMNSMKSSYDIVSSNRKELSSGIITEKEEDAVAGDRW